MKTNKIFCRMSLLMVLFLGIAVVLPVQAEDFSGFTGAPTAEQIQKMQEQAREQAKQQAELTREQAKQQQEQAREQSKQQAEFEKENPGAPIPTLFGSMPAGQNFGPPPGVADMQAKGEAMAKQGAAQQLKGLQQGAKGMEKSLKQFDTLVKKAEKAGSGVPVATKEQYNQIKQNIEKIKAAKSADEIADIDTDALQENISTLMESASSAVQNAEQLRGLKQAITGMEKGLKAFESQLARITKQKIAIPTEITEKVASIKTKITAVKAATTWEEAEAAGVEELQDSMEALNDYRDQLEVLMRLPQMQKQLDQQMNNLNKELKKDQAIVTKLAKNGIDLKEEYTAFSEAIAKLKTVCDEAVAKIKSGNSEEIKLALDNLEENFFGQIGDAMEYSRIIQTMSNLGRFQSEYKKGIADAQKQINQLKKKKVNTAELETILKQSQEKGMVVLALLKVKPLDEEAVMTGMSELEDLRTQFYDKVDELGGGSVMPWEGGAQQFKPITNITDLSSLMPKQ